MCVHVFCREALLLFLEIVFGLFHLSAFDFSECPEHLFEGKHGHRTRLTP